MQRQDKASYVPEKANEGYNGQDIARLSGEVIRRSGIDSYPVDVIKIAHDNDFKVFAQFLPPKVSGMIMVDDDGKFEGFDASRVIVVNQYDPPLRRRFTIAHELAHFFLHRVDTATLYAHRDEGSRSRQETEADQFAMHLLVPEPMLRHAFSEIKSRFGSAPESICKNVISDLFQVTLPELKLRLEQFEAAQRIK